MRTGQCSVRHVKSHPTEQSMTSGSNQTMWGRLTMGGQSVKVSPLHCILNLCIIVLLGAWRESLPGSCVLGLSCYYYGRDCLLEEEKSRGLDHIY